MIIRTALPQDIDTISDFNRRLAEETENKSLDSVTVRAGVERALNLDDEVTYFVAESAGAVIGQLMVTREWSDWRNGWIYWLQSVYVLHERRGQGVFRSLLKHATDHVKQRPDTVGLRLYVEEENSTAQETYRRLGFVQPGYHVMELLFD